MFTQLIATFQAAAGRMREALRDLLRPTSAAAGLARDAFRTRAQLLAENALLRQQLIVARRTARRPQLTTMDRAAMVLMSAFCRTWRDATLLVSPSTVLRWHREGFRLLWKWKSKRQRAAPHRLAQSTIALIQRMARENLLWGAERIRGELLKLGIHVSKRTIQRHLRAPRPSGDGKSWRTFLQNHTVWACDFLQLHDLCFRPIFAFFIVDVNTKRVVHVGVTRSPTRTWVAQQLRNSTPFGQGPEFIIRDRDSKFGADFDRAARGAGTRVLKCPVRSPLVNATCERFLGSVRRECLDHIIILGVRHLKAILGEYVGYFNASRPHQGLKQRIPVGSTTFGDSATGTLYATPILGGLHHDYRRAA